MKLGITGARGFLGSAIAAEARSRDWEVVAFSRNAEDSIPGIAEVRSLADREAIDLSGLDSVIHLAGEPIVGLWTREKKRRIRDSRIDLTGDLVDAFGSIPAEERPSSFVCASAIGYYGDRGDEWLDEESDVGFGFLPEVCRDWESSSARVARHGVRVVQARIGLVLGHGGFLRKVRPLFKSFLGGRLGRGDQWMSWIHVEDLAGIFAECAASSQVRGRVNCVGPHPVRNREFTRTYARALGRAALLPVPRFVLSRLPGGMGCLFLDSQRVDPVVMKAVGYEWKHPELGAALEDIEARR